MHAETTWRPAGPRGDVLSRLDLIQRLAFEAICRLLDKLPTSGTLAEILGGQPVPHKVRRCPGFSLDSHRCLAFGATIDGPASRLIAFRGLFLPTHLALVVPRQVLAASGVSGAFNRWAPTATERLRHLLSRQSALSPAGVAPFIRPAVRRHSADVWSARAIVRDPADRVARNAPLRSGQPQ